VKFLLSRRWVLFALAVALLAVLAVRLGEWQFHRLEERQGRNTVTERNLERAPVPVDEVLAPDGSVDAQDEWRRVTATGTYRQQDTVVVRYQTREGGSGVDVVTPLVTGSGTALLVNRGWLATDNVGTTRPDLPAPPPGEVTVVGYVRADATGDAAAVQDRSTRAVSSARIAGTVEYPIYGGFVELASETPPAVQPLLPAETPDLSEGPHFFYGLQWWFFAALAIFGFGYLAWDERRRRRRPMTGDPAGEAADPTQPASDAAHATGRDGARSPAGS
jgi:cytochrome oxidase assembly protein ShyY1